MSVEDRVIELSRIPRSHLIACPPLPTSCKVETSSRCNNKCRDCAASMNLRPQGDMDMETLKKVVAQMEVWQCHEIGLFLLGDPLLNPDIYKMITEVHRTGADTFITINQNDLARGVVAKMIDCGIDSIKVSMTNNWSTLLAWAARYCAACRVDFSVSMIVRQGEEEQFERTKEVADRYGIKLYGLPLHNCAGRIDNGGKGCPGTWDNPAPLTPCYPLFRGFYVDWKGRNTLCPICHDESMLNGSLRDNSALELWHSEFACDLREQHLSGNITNKTCKACLGL